jgi:hypothetical protein
MEHAKGCLILKRKLYNTKCLPYKEISFTFWCLRILQLLLDKDLFLSPFQLRSHQYLESSSLSPLAHSVFNLSCLDAFYEDRILLQMVTLDNMFIMLIQSMHGFKGSRFIMQNFLKILYSLTKSCVSIEKSF